MSEWADERGLVISAPKSTITLFTPDTHQSHTRPDVSLRNTPLPLERNPRILGVTLDPHFTFGPHVSSIIKRATPRANILRALTGTGWGQQKETLVHTYKQYARPVLEYACAAWAPVMSDTNVAKLQTIQNTALQMVLDSKEKNKESY